MHGLRSEDLSASSAIKKHRSFLGGIATRRNAITCEAAGPDVQSLVTRMGCVEKVVESFIDVLQIMADHKTKPNPQLVQQRVNKVDTAMSASIADAYVAASWQKLKAHYPPWFKEDILKATFVIYCCIPRTAHTRISTAVIVSVFKTFLNCF